MTTTISLPTVQFNRARAFAEKRNLSMDELFTMLIDQMTEEEDDTPIPNSVFFNPYEHTQEELDEIFDKVEEELESEEGITHEQMMADLEKELPWLR